MAEVELSFWAKVALGVLSWTVVSTLFALFLGRLLRDPSQLPEHTEHSVEEGRERNVELAAEPPQPVPASVLARAETVAVALDELPVAELAYDEGEDESTRSSGTRYRPVVSAEPAQQRRLRSVG